MPCPGPSTLASYARQALASEEAVRVREHVTGCAACGEEVLKLATPDGGSTAHASTGVQVPTDPVGGNGRANGGGRLETIGRYVIKGHLGSGGMGVVYAAIDPDLGRKVAIKVLRFGHGAEARTRLVREAQAMARLAHPNVVVVYEVGTVDERVFIAMEHIDGVDLRAWLKDTPHTWRETLAMFLQAGRGLVAAHAAGIVHRDFKPANVLVGRDGRARVVDFGVARGSDDGEAVPAIPDVLSSGELTREGAIIGTPAFMAPEQRRGERATARTDQFSFCLSLYKALYGEPPLSPVTEPPPRGTGVPASLRRALLRGLEADPAARWPSLEELLDRLDRFTRRPRWAIGAALAAVVSAAVAAVVLTRASPARLCRSGADRLAEVWGNEARAKVRSAFLGTGRPYAQATYDRVDQALDAAAEEWGRAHTDACAATRVRGEQSEALLDLRMRCLERVRRQTAALVNLLGTAPDPDALDRAVPAVAAVGDVRACADVESLATRLPPPRDPEAAGRVEAMRARVDELRALYEAGRYQEGGAKARELVAEARTVAYAPALAEALQQDALFERAAGSPAAATTLLYEAVRAAGEARDDVLAARALIRLLTFVGKDLVKPEQAAVLSELAEAAVARAGGDPALRADLLLAQAGALARHGESKEALAKALAGLALFEKLRGPDHDEVAGALALVGGAYLDLAQYGDARRSYERALDILVKTVGPEHPRIAAMTNDLAIALHQQGDLEGAAAAHARALAIQERALGPENRYVASTLFNLAQIRREQLRFAEARELFERALHIKEKVLGPDHPTVGATLLELGRLAIGEGRDDDAQPLLERALEIKTKTFGPDHVELFASLVHLAGVVARRGDFDRAHALLDRADKIGRASAGDESDRVVQVLEFRSAAFLAQKRFAEVVTAVERGLAILHKLPRDGEGQVMISLLTLRARAELATGRDREARADLELAVVVADRTRLGQTEGAWARFELARVLWASPPERSRAVALAEKAREGMRAPGDLRLVDTWLVAGRR